MDILEPGAQPDHGAVEAGELHPALLRLIEALAHADVERDYAQALAAARASRAERAITDDKRS